MSMTPSFHHSGMWDGTPCPGGGFFHQNRMWMCLPDLENLTISIPIFCQISHPSVYHFRKKEHPIWIKLGAFYNNLPKIHPIYVIWAPSFLMKTPRSLYQISRKGAPKGRHIYVYHVNVRTPPGPMSGGYYVHKEYDMSAKLNIWPIFMKITHDNWR